MKSMSIGCPINVDSTSKTLVHIVKKCIKLDEFSIMQHHHIPENTVSQLKL